MSDTRPWRARVLRTDGGVAGAGLLIDQRHVVTCAHVVNNACGRDRREQDPPIGELQLDFVEAEGGSLKAKVLPDGWIPIAADGRGDVAVLQLLMDAPVGARPALLRQPSRLGGHRFETYGYPRHYDMGVSATGVLASWGGPANQWVELQGVEVPGHRVEGGFSGAAVYDLDANAVVGIVVAEDKLAEAKLAWMLPVRTLTQLLEPSWPRLVAIVRSCSMYGPGDLAGHWSPKARGVEREAKRGWYFTGRTKVLRDLVTWLVRGRADGRVGVVTGGPGSGKSAVLARLVTLSDPLYRERVPVLDSTDPAVPPSGSIDVVVWARNKTIEDVVAAIAQSTSLNADSPDDLINALLDRHLPCTIVVDALDEAVEPTGIASKLLRPLATDGAGSGVRVLVGTRPGHGEEYVHALGRSAVRFDLDHPPYLESRDLVEFIRRRLLLTEDPTAWTPYRNRENLVNRVAKAVAARSYPSWLIAQLTCEALVQADRVVNVELRGWERSFPGTVADAMDAYLDRLAESAINENERRVYKRRLRDLLIPLAYAEGAGMPRVLWPAVATKLADRSYQFEDLDWLTDSAADYLIEQATTSGESVYRLYHEALAEYLRSSYTQNELIVHGRFIAALLEMVPSRPDGAGRDWSGVHPYLTAHLAAHAATAGVLDELFSDVGFILAADPSRLLRSLSAVKDMAARSVADVYRLAVHQLYNQSLEEAAACLELVAHQQQNEELVRRIRQLGLSQPWATEWAVWRPTVPHYITGHHVRSVRSVITLETGAGPVAVTGGDDVTLRMWDLHAGAVLGERRTNHDESIWAMAVGHVDDRPVAVTGGADHTVQVWDLRSDAVLARSLGVSTGSVWAVAVGRVGGRPVAVTGGGDSAVRVWDLGSGEYLSEILSIEVGPVYSIEVGEVDGTPIAVTGGTDGTVQVRNLRTSEPFGEPLVGHTGPVWSIALSKIDGRPVAVSGSSDGTVRVWDLRTGALLGEPLVGHTGSIYAVAVGVANARPVIVTGGMDETVRLWDLRTGESLGEPLIGHTGPVYAVAVGVVNGQPVAVTGSSDGTVRVWDLEESSSITKLSNYNGLVSAVGVSEVNSRPVAVIGSEDTTVRLWDLREGTLINSSSMRHAGPVRAVTVGSVDGQPVALTVGTDETVRVWDLHRGIQVGRSLVRNLDPVDAVAMSELNGTPIAVTAGSGGTVRIWDLYENTRIGSVLKHPVYALSTIAVGKVEGQPVLITGSRSGMIRIWDLQTGMEVAKFFTGDVEEIYSIGTGYVEGRPVAVTGGSNGTARIWDLYSTAMVGEPLIGHRRAIYTVALGEVDGRSIVLTGGQDQTVRIWNIESLRQTVANVGVPVRAIAYVQTSQVLVGTSRGLVLLSNGTR